MAMLVKNILFLYTNAKRPTGLGGAAKRAGTTHPFWATCRHFPALRRSFGHRSLALWSFVWSSLLYTEGFWLGWSGPSQIRTVVGCFRGPVACPTVRCRAPPGGTGAQFNVLYENFSLAPSLTAESQYGPLAPAIGFILLILRDYW